MKKTKGQSIIEICRSFSYKMNIPGAYESRDFFASAKKEVKESEADKTSEALYNFVKGEVIKSVNIYRKEILAEGKQPEVKPNAYVQQLKAAPVLEARERIAREELEEAAQKLNDFTIRKEGEADLGSSVL